MKIRIQYKTLVRIMCYKEFQEILNSAGCRLSIDRMTILGEDIFLEIQLDTLQ